MLLIFGVTGIRQINVLFVRYNRRLSIVNAVQSLCQGNQLTSVLGVAYFLESYRDQTDQHFSMNSSQ